MSSFCCEIFDIAKDITSTEHALDGVCSMLDSLRSGVFRWVAVIVGSTSTIQGSGVDELSTLVWCQRGAGVDGLKFTLQGGCGVVLTTLVWCQRGGRIVRGAGTDSLTWRITMQGGCEDADGAC